MYFKNIKNYFINGFLVFLVYGSFMTFLSIHLKSHGFSESFVGTILSLQTFAIAVGSIIAGISFKKYGFKKSMVFSILLICINGIITSIYLNKSIQIIASLGFGLGMAFQFTGESPFLMKQTVLENRVKIFSLNFSLKNFSMMLGSFLSGILSDANLNTTYTLFLFSILTLISIIPLLRIEDIVLETKNSFTKDYKTILKDSSILKLLLFNGLIGMGAGLIVPFFSIYIKYTLHVNNSIVGTIISISQFGTVIGGLLIPFLSKTYGKVKTVLLCQAISIPFLLSISFAPGLIIVGISFFIRTALMNMAQPLIQNLSMELVEEESMSIFSSFITLSSNMFRSLGIFFGGIMMHNITYNAPYYVTCIFYIIAMFVFSKLFENLRFKANNLV